MSRTFLLAAVFAGAGILSSAGPPKQVTIPEANIHQYEDGPNLSGSYEFLPGETVFVTARFAQYTASEDEEKPHVRLLWEADVLDPAGIKVVETKKDKIDADLSPQDKEWMPKIHYDFVLPTLADSGTYKLVLRLKDDLSGTTATRELPLRVKGHEVAPSDALVIRNFRWQRGEEEGQAVTSAAYRPGDPVWARFDITGYRFGEGNRFDVSYGLEVFRATGESMYSQPVAAEKSEESFYRQRYMPGALNLNLQPDIAKGDYTVVLRAEDHVGDQKFEEKYIFHVE